ncbi:MAG: biopolymer transporter ExbD [Chitinophagales bacterium]|nr:biopolymer transporter ExbD [Chitinophagales bacterium]
MASIDTGGGDSGHKKGPGVKKAKKMSTRIDMTPMVDLGFLLITFFIFTTTMSSPSTMDLFMPKDTEKDEDQNKAKQSGALTILLAKDNTAYYYEGELAPDASNFKSVKFSELRQIIINKKKDVISRYVNDPKCVETKLTESKARGREKTRAEAEDECKQADMVVVIKPNKESTYKNTVDILDEMTINNIKRFALVNISPVEDELIAKTEGASGGQ